MTSQPPLDVRTFFKRWPRFYYAIMVVFGPACFIGLSSRAFLKKYPRAGTAINLGSGPRVLGSDIVNVDMFEYPGVSIVADVCNVPLADGSVARIVSDNVLEHVDDPVTAVSEMHRLLESGGLAYVSTPFLYPFHSSPSDYYRWTAQGYKKLFSDFEIIEFGVRSGPFSALTALLCHTCGVLFSFGSPALNSLFTNLFMFVFFPIKYLDVIFAYWPQASDVASVFYCVVRKN